MTNAEFFENTIGLYPSAKLTEEERMGAFVESEILSGASPALKTDQTLRLLMGLS